MDENVNPADVGFARAKEDDEACWRSLTAKICRGRR